MCKQFGINIVKTVAALGNFLLLCVAAGLCARAAITLANFKHYQYILDSGIQTIPLIGLIFAVLFILTCLFGFLGMILNAFGMICFFVTLLFLLGISSTVTGVYVLSEVNEMQRDHMYFQNKMDQGYNITQSVQAMESIDAMQIDLQCCGFQWGKYQYYNENTLLPTSCCKDPSVGACYGDDIWPESCLSKLEMHGVVTHSEQGTMMVCLGAQAIMLGGIGYVLAMAVRQYYYY